MSIKGIPAVLTSDENQLLFEQVFVDQQEPSTSGILGDMGHMHMDGGSQSPLGGEKK